MDNNEEKNEMIHSPEISTPEMKTPEINMEGAMKEKSKMPKIIIIILIILLVGIGTFFAIKSNLFASNSERFLNLATKDQKFLEVLEDVQKEKQINTSFTVDFDEIAKELGDNSNQKIGTFKIENTHINDKDDFSNVTQLKMTSINKTIEIQIAKTGNIVGFHIPDVTDKFIAVDLDDPEGLLNNLQKMGLDVSSKTSNKLDKEETKKLEKMVEKYIKMILKEADPFIIKTPNVEVSMEENTEKATEYRFDLTQESFAKVFLPALKEFAKNDDDMHLLIELYDLEYDVKEMKEALKDSIEELEDEIKKNEFDETVFMTLKLYEKAGKNIATVIEMENTKIGLYVFQSNKEYQLIFDMDTGEAQLRIKWELKSSGNKKEGKLGIKGNNDNGRFDFTLLEYEQEVLNKIKDEMIKVSKNDSLLLNTVTREELEKFSEKTSKNLQQFLSDVAPNFIEEEKETASMASDASNLVDSIESNPKTELKDGYLKKAMELFDQVEVGMTEEEVINAIGKADKVVDGSDSKSLYYTAKVGNYDVDLMHVFIYHEKVSIVSIDIMSSRFNNINIGKELNAQLDDLEESLKNVKEGMTLPEVEKILGTAYFRNSKDNKSGNYISYTWYDAQEHNVRISFADGKVFYIGIVW